MGVDATLMLKLLATPHKQVYWLTRDELQTARLANQSKSGEELITGTESDAWMVASPKAAAALAKAVANGADKPKVVTPVSAPAAVDAAAEDKKSDAPNADTPKPDTSKAGKRTAALPVPAPGEAKPEVQPKSRSRPNSAAITAPGASRPCTNYETSCTAANAHCRDNCTSRNAGSRCFNDCATAITYCRDSGIWSTTNCLKPGMTR